MKTVFAATSPTIVIKEVSTGKATNPRGPSVNPSPGLTEDEQKQLNEGI